MLCNFLSNTGDNEILDYVLESQDLEPVIRKAAFEKPSKFLVKAGGLFGLI